MTSTWKGDGGGLKICLMSPDSFAFKQSIILFIFADGGGGRSQN